MLERLLVLIGSSTINSIAILLVILIVLFFFTFYFVSVGPSFDVQGYQSIQCKRKIVHHGWGPKGLIVCPLSPVHRAAVNTLFHLFHHFTISSSCKFNTSLPSTHCEPMVEPYILPCFPLLIDVFPRFKLRNF